MAKNKAAAERIRPLLDRIESASAGRRITLMEVCGTHTVAIAKNGIRDLLPPNVRLISGPGCPVCVTPTASVDQAIALARLPDVILCTFGDMLRAPGSEPSLASATARGASTRVVYSPRQCLDLAREHGDQKIIFFAVGFETTQPGIAATVIEAEQNGVDNLLVLPAMKLIPPAMRLLMDDERVNVDGFILPGHVSAVLGLEPYSFLADEFGRSGVVAGFEGHAILEAVARLVELIAQGTASIENAYRGVVRAEGNPVARAMVERAFLPADARWRGMGVLPDSGLALRPRHQNRDASRIEVELPPATERDSACRCGEVLRGVINPNECAAFGSSCTPERPVGPCMVSSEGTCQARYRYGRQ